MYQDEALIPWSGFSTGGNCTPNTVNWSEQWFVKDIDGDGRDDIIRLLICISLVGDNEMKNVTSEIGVYLSRITPAGQLTFDFHSVGGGLLESGNELPMGDFEGVGRASIIVRGIFAPNQLLYWNGTGLALKSFASALARPSQRACLSRALFRQRIAGNQSLHEAASAG